MTPKQEMSASSYSLLFALLTLPFGAKPSLAASHDCPSACFCDEESQYVSCVGDGTWKIPQDLPRSSERLELRNFAVDIITPQVLETVVALKELKLQQSQTKVIEDNALSMLELLQRLDLSQNLLENLTSGTFRGLQQLKYLDLSSNQLDHIDGAFAELGNLEQLNLRGNLLTQLSTYTFTGLHHAQYLNLDSNLLSSLEVGAFQYLANLAHLILSNNPLTSLSRLDFFGSRLQYIDASHVGLERVPQSLTRYVRDLRLGRNNITRINLGDLDSYPHLGLLVLDDNAIEDVEDDALGRQEYLVRLWLNGNRLTRIPLNLPQTLVALYIEENSVEELLPHSFPGLSNLEQLFLQRNQIKTIADCAFCDLSKLKTLDLQANLIETLSNGAFTNLTSLTMLDVSQNPIKTFEPLCFWGLDKLQTLQLSRLTGPVEFEDFVFDALKELTKLEMYDSSELAAKVINSTRTLHSLKNIQELNLMHNKLLHLRPDFPSFFPKLRVFKIGGNNFDCGSAIHWFSQWIKTSSIQFYRSYSIRCASPPALQFKPIMLLSEDDFQQTTTAAFLESPSNATASVGTPLSAQTAVVSETEPVIGGVVEFYNGSTDIPILGPRSLLLIAPRILEAKPSGSITTTAQNSMNSTLLIEDTNTGDSNTSRSMFQHIEMEGTPSLTPNKSDASSSSETPPDHSMMTAIQNHTTLAPMSTVRVHNAESSPELLILTTVLPQTSTSDNASSAAVSATRSILLASAVAEKQQQQRPTTTRKVANTSTLVTGFGFFLLVALLAGLFLLQTRRSCTRCRENYSRMRRSSSISYHPQRDEVNILTVSDGTISERTSTHHSLRNKLYYAMQSNEPHEAFHEPHLQELIPRSLTDSTRCGGHVSI